DDHAGIQNQRPSPLDLFREFHVGNDEAKVVLGLKKRRYREVTTDERYQETHGLGKVLGERAAVEDRFNGHGEQGAKHQAPQQAEVDGRDGCDLLIAYEQITGDGYDTDQQDQRERDPACQRTSVIKTSDAIKIADSARDHREDNSHNETNAHKHEQH